MNLTITNDTCEDIIFNGNYLEKLYFGNDLVWEKRHGIDYSKEYFCIESLEDNNEIKFKIDAYILSNIESLEYSYDKSTWNNMTLPSSQSSSKTNTFSLNNGDLLYIRGVCKSYARTRTTSSDTNYYSNIYATKTFKVSGNINSLMRSDWMTNNSAPTPKYIVYGNVYYKDLHLQHLFYNSTKLVDSSNLIIPFDNLNDIYRLEDEYGNIVGSTTWRPHSMTAMFYGCTSLINGPQLTFSTFGTYSGTQMFYNCSSLNNITCLATNLSTDCCGLWTYGVAANGTFVKKTTMSSWPTGTSGIPSGWTVQDA